MRAYRNNGYHALNIIDFMSESGPITDDVTVLIVDDDENTADVYAEFLDGYRVLTAYSGKKALTLIDETVDVVLLDRRMPGMTGDDVLRAIRARSIDCRVVMITAIEPEIDVLELPFDDYLIKPVSPDQLRETVSEMVVRNACNRSLREMFAITSKMATIESKMDLAELQASPEYAALGSEFADLRSEVASRRAVGNAYAEFTDEKLQGLLG